jgi:hypothetical protein
VVFAEPVGITPIPPLNLTKFWARAELWARADLAMIPMANTMLPTATDVPKKERRLMARFAGWGFDVDVLNNDAEIFFVEFIVGESH